MPWDVGDCGMRAFGLVSLALALGVAALLLIKVQTVDGQRYFGPVADGKLVGDGAYLATWVIVVLLVALGLWRLFGPWPRDRHGPR